MIEADDRETHAAIAATQDAESPIDVIEGPSRLDRAPSRKRSMSRYRSRAAAFIVIYDAEDRPEPDQLRRALQAFS